MNNISLRDFIPAIVWFFIVLVLICMPGQDIPQINSWSQFLEKIHFDKIVHATMFGIMMVLFGNPFHRTELSNRQKLQFFIRIALLISFWGFITECIQLYVPKRSFDLLDWAADSLGVFIAFIFLAKFMIKSEKL